MRIDQLIHFFSQKKAIFLLSGVCFFIHLLFFFQPGLPAGSDLSLELVRIIEYKHALLTQGFPPLHAEHLYSGWGSPIFQFYGPLFMLFTALIDTVLNNIHWSVKVSSFILSLIGTFSIYGIFKTLYTNSLGILGAVLFSLNTYKFVDLILRNAYGEFTAFMLIPFCIYSTIQFCKKPNLTNGILVGLGSALMSIAHNISFFFFFPAIFIPLILWSIWNNTKKDSATVIITIILGILASSWFLIPMISFLPWVSTSDLLKGGLHFSHHFVGLQYLLFEPTSWFFLGYLAIPQCLGNLFAWRYSTTWRSDLGGLSMFMLWIFSICLITPQSAFLWELLSPLQMIQFPWRWSLVISIAGLWNLIYLLHLGYTTWKHTAFGKLWNTALLQAFSFSLILLTLSTTLITIGRLENNNFGVGLHAKDIQTKQLKTTVFDEYLPTFVPTAPKIISTKETFQTKPYQYERCAEPEATSVSFPLIPLPYWQGYADGKPIEYVKQIPILTYTLPSSIRCVHVRLESTEIHKISIIISILSSFLLCCFLWHRYLPIKIS